MIKRFINRIIERWLCAIAREFIKEAKDIERYTLEERRIFIGIAAALNRANVKMFE
jgi:hypothetical protein